MIFEINNPDGAVRHYVFAAPFDIEKNSFNYFGNFDFTPSDRSILTLDATISADLTLLSSILSSPALTFSFVYDILKTEQGSDIYTFLFELQKKERDRK